MDGDAAASPVPELVAQALAGDHRSWEALVERYTPLLLSVVRKYGLRPADAEDVVQTVWLRLVEHLRDLRDPVALPRYVFQTATHECYRLFSARRHVVLTDPTGPGLPERDDAPPVDAGLIAEDRRHRLLGAVAGLPDRQRALLMALLEDPPPSYEEISRRLDMPIGSIGPTRARALQRLRQVAEELELR